MPSSAGLFSSGKFSLRTVKMQTVPPAPLGLLRFNRARSRPKTIISTDSPIPDGKVASHRRAPVRASKTTSPSASDAAASNSTTPSTSAASICPARSANDSSPASARDRSCSSNSRSISARSSKTIPGSADKPAAARSSTPWAISPRSSVTSATRTSACAPEARSHASAQAIPHRVNFISAGPAKRNDPPVTAPISATGVPRSARRLPARRLSRRLLRSNRPRPRSGGPWRSRDRWRGRWPSLPGAP